MGYFDTSTVPAWTICIGSEEVTGVRGGTFEKTAAALQWIWDLFSCCCMGKKYIK